MVSMPIAWYSRMRSAICSGVPTSAVPAPPRTRPTPAHRLGETTQPVAAAAMQFGHAPLSDRIHLLGKRAWAFSICASVTWLISRSAARQASSSVSRTMKCSRMPKRSLRPRRVGLLARRAELFGDLRRRLAPGQVHVDQIGGEVLAGVGRAAEIERRPLLARQQVEAAIVDAVIFAVEIDAARPTPARARWSGIPAPAHSARHAAGRRRRRQARSDCRRPRH